MDRELSRIYRALILDRCLLRCCWEFVDCKISRWIENLSKSCRDKFQNTSMDRRCNKIYREKQSKGLDRRLSVEICWEAVELDKNSFSKKRKTQKWMQSNKLLNQRSQQNFKLSKTSLNKKNVKHLDTKHTHTHTHTHTLNKSNQFYISKTRQDNLVSIH